MSEATITEVPAVRLPPGPTVSRALMGIGFALFRRPVVARLADKDRKSVV